MLGFKYLYLGSVAPLMDRPRRVVVTSHGEPYRLVSWPRLPTAPHLLCCYDIQPHSLTETSLFLFLSLMPTGRRVHSAHVAREERDSEPKIELPRKEREKESWSGPLARWWLNQQCAVSVELEAARRLGQSCVSRCALCRAVHSSARVVCCVVGAWLALHACMMCMPAQAYFVLTVSHSPFSGVHLNDTSRHQI